MEIKITPEIVQTNEGRDTKHYFYEYLNNLFYVIKEKILCSALKFNYAKVSI